MSTFVPVGGLNVVCGLTVVTTGLNVVVTGLNVVVTGRGTKKQLVMELLP
jgi:hypothetical protein